MLRLLATGLLLTVLLATGQGAPTTSPVKPRDVARPYVLYLPFYAIAPMAKLGVSGSSAAQVTALGGSWFYTWGPQGQGTRDVEFVPMIWGERDMGAQVPAEARWLLGFNEPDGQSDIAPERAAQLWREIERLYPDKRLVSPAPSHIDPAWLKRMRAAYLARYGQPPRFDAIAVHSYRATAAAVIADVELYLAWAAEWDVPEVWLTEFAFLPGWSGPAWERETREFLRWAEAEPRLTRYSPFIGHLAVPDWSWPTADPALNPSLFTAPGGLELTALGRVYQRTEVLR